MAQEFLDAIIQNGEIASPNATNKDDDSKLPQEPAFTTDNGICSGIWFTTACGRRRTSWDTFIAPLLHMPNLTVLHDFFAHRILWNKNVKGEQLHASAVEGALNGSPLQISFSCSSSGANAGRNGEPHEILLCCGALGSPTLLMHSGVGPRRSLEKAGVTVFCDAPFVGVGLQDHVVLPIGWYVPRGSNVSSLNTTTIYSNGVRATVEGKASNGNALQLLLHDSTNVIEIIESISRYLFVSTLMRWLVFIALWILFTIPFSRMLLKLLLKRRFFVTSVCLTGVTSSGNITLASPDPYVIPIIDPCYLSQESEWAALEEGLKLALSPRMREHKYPDGSLSPIPLLPGILSTQGGKGFRQLVKDLALPYFHHCASCRMPCRMRHNREMSSSITSECEEGAVDSELRVRGVDGVRVVDCSIACHIPSSPINAMAMMIGDCAARIIIDQWAGSKRDGTLSSTGFSSLVNRVARGQLPPESL